MVRAAVKEKLMKDGEVVVGGWCLLEVVVIHEASPESHAKLLSELPGEVERDASEVGVAQKVVQVVRQQFKHQAQVLAKEKVPFEFDCCCGLEVIVCVVLLLFIYLR